MPMGPEVWPHFRDTIKMIRALQPDLMFRNRGIGNYGDYYTPEGFVPGDPANTDMPWMVIYPLGRSFSYEPEASKHKGEKWIIHNLIDSAAKGGNFMVGIGPDLNGKFHPEAVRELLETGKWLKQNGEAIYATRRWTFWKEGEKVRFTRSRDGRYVYALLLNWPGTEFRSRVLKPKPGSEARMLEVDQPLAWKITGGELTVHIPPELFTNPPGAHAWALRFEI